ncbi:MAG: hypothetical protein AAGK17_03995 [Pseudomonadota bacterium]
MPILALIVMAGWWYGIRPIAAEQGWVEVNADFPICGNGSSGAKGCIADGDTIIIGFGEDRRRIRLIGFDTPELNGACAAERKTALDAQNALQTWLARGAFEWNGADEPPYDQYGRELREVRRMGSDGKTEYLAETMIGRGLAGENGWGAEPIDWCK